MTTTLPSTARVVIVGGGIAGCSLAYHLTKLGWSDVVLLERARLTSGTTWHAAGLVGQMRPTRNMTLMSKYGIELYAGLEAETGLATGWKQCGSVNVARTPERMIAFRRQVALARGFGVEMHLISPEEAGRKWPLLRIDDLQGAIWIPHDGKANPADVTQALAKGARNRGARLIEGVTVTGFATANGRVAGVRTDKGDIASEIVVNCAGQWARQVGAMAGVTVPLYSAEHFYIVTKPIAGVAPDLPVVRDPDGFIYYKEEVGGLVMGGFEPVAKPWLERIPDDFEFQLLPEDWDQFEPLMRNAVHRTPCLETAEVKMLLNGPESFTPDGNFVIGEAPELRGFYVSAGFNSAGIANGGGAGRLLAEWIVGGEPPLDVWDVDIRRFAPFYANARHLKERTVESLGLHYAMRWPRQELESARPLRRSPLYDRLQARGARFGAKLGWERPLYFDRPGAPPPAYGYEKPGWLPLVEAEQRAVRDAAGIFDQTSFSKFVIQGRDAVAFLQHLCANDVDVPFGRMVYTALLNSRGGFESDLTLMRTGPQEYFVVTGTAQTTRDADWIRRNIGERFVTLTDVTGAWSVISVMGPRAAELIAGVSSTGFDASAIAAGSFAEIDVGYARVRAARMSYVGGPGFELYVPVEFAAHVYDTLTAAGAGLGLRDCGYYTIDALRIEAGRRAWSAELGPDETPLEAGLMHAVKFDKGEFLGRAALLKQREAGARKRLAIFVLDDPEAWPWGGEGILRDGEPVGEVTSAGWSTALGRAVVMGYVRGKGAAIDRARVLAGRYELDIAGTRAAMTVQAKPPYGG
ncbi:MAG: FAD-dependent oxidoreductase [Alphaproteobacteria bacterium]|nr:FAD-dependent oxidoreductase [Alphaproteobacteria bacterium]